MAGLNVQTENLLSIARVGDTAIFRINPVTASEGSTILFEGGQVKWGVPTGLNGRELELSASDTQLLWRYVGDVTWNVLVDLDSLNQGPPGMTAYEVAVSEGFEGTISEWLASLAVVPLATDITYDNSVSGLSAENIKTAIDEVAELYNTLSWTAPNYETVNLPATPPDGEVAFDIDINRLMVGFDEIWHQVPIIADAMITVVHGSNTSFVRPAGAGTVYWKGSVEPNNAVNGDIWYDTTGD